MRFVTYREQLIARARDVGVSEVDAFKLGTSVGSYGRHLRGYHHGKPVRMGEKLARDIWQAINRLAGLPENDGLEEVGDDRADG